MPKTTALNKSPAKTYSTFGQKVVTSSGFQTNNSWSILRWICPFCIESPSPIKTRKGSVPVIKVTRFRSPSTSDEDDAPIQGSDGRIISSRPTSLVSKSGASQTGYGKNAYQDIHERSRGDGDSGSSCESLVDKERNFKKMSLTSITSSEVSIPDNINDISSPDISDTDEFLNSPVPLRRYYVGSSLKSKRSNSLQEQNEKVMSPYLAYIASKLSPRLRQRKIITSDEYLTKDLSLKDFELLEPKDHFRHSYHAGIDTKKMYLNDYDFISDKQKENSERKNSKNSDLEESLNTITPSVFDGSKTPLTEGSVTPNVLDGATSASKPDILCGCTNNESAENSDANSYNSLSRDVSLPSTTWNSPDISERTFRINENKKSKKFKSKIGNFLKGSQSSSETSSPVLKSKIFGKKSKNDSLPSSAESSPILKHKNLFAAKKKTEINEDLMSPTLRLRHKILNKKLSELAITQEQTDSANTFDKSSDVDNRREFFCYDDSSCNSSPVMTRSRPNRHSYVSDTDEESNVVVKLKSNKEPDEFKTFSSLVNQSSTSRRDLSSADGASRSSSVCYYSTDDSRCK